jgi:hypothetical protein
VSIPLGPPVLLVMRWLTLGPTKVQNFPRPPPSAVSLTIVSVR